MEQQSSQRDSLYARFCALRMSQLEDCLLSSQDHRERAFWRALLDLKLQMEQELVVGEDLL